MNQVSVSKARSIIVLAEVENADQVHKARTNSAITQLIVHTAI